MSANFSCRDLRACLVPHGLPAELLGGLRTIVRLISKGRSSVGSLGLQSCRT